MNTEVVIERFITDELLLGDGQTRLDPDESLVSSGLLDSIALHRLIVFMEERFGITIKASEVHPDNFQTINLIKALIETKM